MERARSPSRSYTSRMNASLSSGLAKALSGMRKNRLPWETITPSRSRSIWLSPLDFLGDEAEAAFVLLHRDRGVERGAALHLGNPQPSEEIGDAKRDCGDNNE